MVEIPQGTVIVAGPGTNVNLEIWPTINLFRCLLVAWIQQRPMRLSYTFNRSFPITITTSGEIDG